MTDWAEQKARELVGGIAVVGDEVYTIAQALRDAKAAGRAEMQEKAVDAIRTRVRRNVADRRSAFIIAEDDRCADAIEALE